MAGVNKRLTVTYGAFSCTLEGFDDAFEAMKAITEYFRDLSAGDRYFGAVPPTPDADLVRRIAEKEMHRRVEAQVEDQSVFLRASDITRGRSAAGARTDSDIDGGGFRAASLEPSRRHDSGVAGESVAARLARIRTMAARSRAAEGAAAASIFSEDDATKLPAPAGDETVEVRTDAEQPEGTGSPAGMDEASTEAASAPQDVLAATEPEAAVEPEHAGDAAREDDVPVGVEPDDADETMHQSAHEDAAEPATEAAASDEDSADAMADEPVHEAEQEASSGEVSEPIAEPALDADTPFGEISAEVPGGKDHDVGQEEPTTADEVSLDAQLGSDQEQQVDEVEPDAAALEAAPTEQGIDESVSELDDNAIEDGVEPAESPDLSETIELSSEEAPEPADASEPADAADGGQPPIEQPTAYATETTDAAEDTPEEPEVVSEVEAQDFGRVDPRGEPTPTLSSAVSQEADETEPDHSMSGDDTDDAPQETLEEAREPDEDVDAEPMTGAAALAAFRASAGAGVSTPDPFDASDETADEAPSRTSDMPDADEADRDADEGHPTHSAGNEEQAIARLLAMATEARSSDQAAAADATSDSAESESGDVPAPELADAPETLESKPETAPPEEGEQDHPGVEEHFRSFLGRLRAIGRPRNAEAPEASSVATVAAPAPPASAAAAPETIPAAEIEEDAERPNAPEFAAQGTPEAQDETPTDAVPATADADEDVETSKGDGREEPPFQSRPGGPNEGDVDRIAETAREQLEEAANQRRLAAIAHLKAAVAATEADRALGSDEEVEGSEIDRYREDLSRVMQPKRPISRGESNKTGSEARRPSSQPLVLDAGKRIDDRGAMPGQTSGVGAKIEGDDFLGMILPRRVSAASIAPLGDAEDGVEAEEDDTEEAAATRSPSVPFADFAENAGATELFDLLEAAAAYLSVEEGRSTFSRPQVMRKVAQVPREDEITREEGLRAFGALLREGVIEKQRRGRFTISQQSRYVTQGGSAAS